MRRLMRLALTGAALLILASAVRLASASAQALTQDTVESELQGVDAAKDISLGAEPNNDVSVYAMPIPIVDPTIGNGLALGGLMTFRLDPADKISPRASLALGAGYTDSDSGAFGGNLKLFLDRDLYHVDLLTGYGALNDRIVTPTFAPPRDEAVRRVELFDPPSSCDKSAISGTAALLANVY